MGRRADGWGRRAFWPPTYVRSSASQRHRCARRCTRLPAARLPARPPACMHACLKGRPPRTLQAVTTMAAAYLGLLVEGKYHNYEWKKCFPSKWGKLLAFWTIQIIFGGLL